LIKNVNISPTPPNARDDQPRTSVPQLPLRRSVNPPGRGPLHFISSSVSPGGSGAFGLTRSGGLSVSVSPAK
jgi:hypothetical protein